jgi:uncharacterized protein YjbI with pentapeptide repeats
VRADLGDACLESAYLAAANLRGANLQNAQLKGADLINLPIGTPHQPVCGLTVSQLAEAVVDESTRLPDELRQASNAMAALPKDGPDPLIGGSD